MVRKALYHVILLLAPIFTFSQVDTIAIHSIKQSDTIRYQTTGKPVFGFLGILTNKNKIISPINNSAIKDTLVAAANKFPKNSLIRLTNLKNAKYIDIKIVKNLSKAAKAKGQIIEINKEVAALLGIENPIKLKIKLNKLILNDLKSTNYYNDILKPIVPDTLPFTDTIQHITYIKT